MTLLTLLQAQTLLSLTTADVEKVYSGRPSANGNHCRCGCRGSYRYASDAALPKHLDASDVNDRQVAKALRIVQEHATEATGADGWFDAEVDGRSYTIYVKAGN